MLLLAALSLRLSLTAQALPLLRQTAEALVGSPAIWQAALFLELGAGAAPDAAGAAALGSAGAAAPGGPPSDTSPVESAAPDGPPSADADDQTGRRGDVPYAEPSTAPTSAAADTPAQAPLFFASEARELTLRGNCSYKPELAELLLSATELSPDTAVLIVHTHASEAYTPSLGCEYEPSGDFRTLEPERSVVAVGEALAEALRALGVTVIHDTAFNDYPSYNSSYANARARILEQLGQHPEIGMVLDLHRDALAQPLREEAELDGETCAPMMLVVGTDEGGLEHPHWQKNLACALKLQTLAQREHPGLMKPISLRRERFNGDLSPASLIIEVGSTENTLPEAKIAVQALAQAVAALLGVDMASAGS